MSLSSVNPYETPSSDLAPTAAYGYHCVGSLKLSVMSLCTFGLYTIYWFYRNFTYIKQHRGLKIWPVWRALFSPFWGSNLTNYVNVHREKLDLRVDLSPAFVGGIYFILSLLGLTKNPYWLISFFTFVPLLRVDRAADEANAKMNIDTTERKKFSRTNKFGVVVGGLLTILGVIGNFLPE